MCRMIVGAGKISVDYLVDGLLQMAKNGKNHKDGWGIAYSSGKRIEVEKSSYSCILDESIQPYRKLSSPLVALHARKAVKEVSTENTHPFHFSHEGVEYAFCHNSWFTKAVPGSGDACDPKRFLHYVRKFLKPGDEEASLARALSELDNFIGANCILMSPDKAVVSVRYNKKPEYYEMAYSPGPRSVVVSSEKLPGRIWLPLCDKSILSVKPDGRFALQEMYPLTKTT